MNLQALTVLSPAQWREFKEPMSRKRALRSAHTDLDSATPSKRHLNNALAAELQSLRISKNQVNNNLPRHAYPVENPFGTAFTSSSSPFLPMPSPSPFASSCTPDSSFSFSSFKSPVSVTQQQPEKKKKTTKRHVDFEEIVNIQSPSSSSSSLDNEQQQPGITVFGNTDSKKEKSRCTKRRRTSLSSSSSCFPLNSCDAYATDVTIEETDEPVSESSNETRVIVYNSCQPATSVQSTNSMSTAIVKFNQFNRNSTPPIQTRHLFKLPSCSYASNELAVVPWKPPCNPIVTQLQQQPDKVICMPWTGSENAGQQQEMEVDIADAVTGHSIVNDGMVYEDQGMQIEEIR